MLVKIDSFQRRVDVGSAQENTILKGEEKEEAVFEAPINIPGWRWRPYATISVAAITYYSIHL